MTKLSIVTIHKGNLKSLSLTINSIYPKLNSSIEHIVVGNVPEENSELLIELCYLSKCIVNEDKSLYDAMNIGLQNAKGTFINFMNSGDELIGDIPIDKLNIEACYLFRTLLFMDSIEYQAVNIKLNHQNFIAPLNTSIRYIESFGLFADAEWMSQSIKIYGLIVIEDIYARFSYGGISTKPGVIEALKNFRFDRFFYSRIKLVIKSFLLALGLEIVNKKVLLKSFG